MARIVSPGVSQICLDQSPRLQFFLGTSPPSRAYRSDLWIFPHVHVSNVFWLKRVSQLPSLRLWDCAINILPSEPVPRRKVYPLFIPEQKAIEEYIEEALQQGFLCHSTSPAAFNFLFVSRKDRGLQPCIDYQTFNKITIKFHYPLPLILATLEQLCRT